MKPTRLVAIIGIAALLLTLVTPALAVFEREVKIGATQRTVKTTLTRDGEIKLTGVNMPGGSFNPFDYTGTIGIMNGNDTFILFDVNLTNADHTGSTNYVTILDVANITGDAHATETAIKIGTGWDAALTAGSLVNLNAGLAMDTNVFTIADTTGALVTTPTATTGEAWTLNCNTLTSGNAIKIVADDDILNGGKYINLYGGAAADTSVLAIGENGVITFGDGGTIDGVTGSDVINITETTVRVTGALDVTGGFTTDTNALAVADTTGVITLKGAATIDNNASADVLNLTETTVRVTGAFDVTGASTLADTVTATYSKTAAADVGTARALYGKYALTGDTPLTTAYNNIIGVRGEANIAAASVITAGAYIEGVQGKLIFAGTMNHEDSRLAAGLMQLDISAGTYTAGQMSALWVDCGASASSSAVSTKGGGQFNILRLTNTTAASNNALIFGYADADFLAELGAPGGSGDWFNTALTPTTNGGWLKVKVGGETRYIALYTTDGN